MAGEIWRFRGGDKQSVAVDLNAAAKAGCAMELNTAGLRKDCREIYPSRAILELANTKGVAITFGRPASSGDGIWSRARPTSIAAPAMRPGALQLHGHTPPALRQRE